MDKEKIEKFLLKFTKIGIFVALLTPLILGPFGINFAEYPKAIFFRVTIEIVFLFYILLLLIDLKYFPKKSILLASLLLFYIVLFVSSIFGINFYKSFFGEMQRGEGLIAHLHFLAFFIIITGVFLKKDEWINLLKASVIVSGLSSVVAILQQTKVALFYSMESFSLSGTLSNPNLFANYIVLAIFTAIFLWMSESNKNLKILWAFIIILNCYTLFFSNTRGALIGFVAGALFFILFSFIDFNRKNKIILFTLASIICILVLLIIFNFQWVKSVTIGTFLERFTGSSLSGRVEIWKAALIAIKERPIIGWGGETSTYVSDKYMEGLGGGIYFDRTHNKVLEILVYGGIIGFTAYLLVFFAIFYSLFKNTKIWQVYNGKPKKFYSLPLAGFFIAYFVQNIFSFDNICTYILFFLVVGFINNNFCNFPSFFKKKTNGLFSFKNYKLALSFKIVVIIFAFLSSGWLIYNINLKPTIAAMYFSDNMVYEKTDALRAVLGYKKGIEMNTFYDYDLRLTFSDRLLYLLEAGTAESDKKKIYEDLLIVKPFLYQNIENKDGQMNHSYNFLARISEQGYLIYKNPDDLAEMDKIMKEYIEFNPKILGAYLLLGELKIFQNKYSEGETAIKKSVEISNDGYDLDLKIGSAYAKKGDFILAVENFEKVINFKYELKKNNPESPEVSLENIQFIDYVAVLYCEQLNDLQNCKRIYKKAAEVYPQYANALGQQLESILPGVTD